MFHGSTIPNNWTICDGTNSTPNMIGRFPVSSNMLTESGTIEEKTLVLKLSEEGHHSHSIGGSHKDVLVDVLATGKRYDGIITNVTINDNVTDATGSLSGTHTHDVQQVVELKPDLVKMVFIMKIR